MRKLTSPLLLLLTPGLLLALAHAPAAHADDVTVPAVAETPPVRSSDDAADDAAIWVHPSDPALSAVIGTDKLPTGGIGVYDLQGNELHFYLHGSMNNVDLRYNFPLGGESVSLVGVTERNDGSTGARFYKVNPADRSLTPVGRIDTSGRPRGFGMYHSPVTGKYYAFLHDFHTNVVTQYELDGSSGQVEGTPVRAFDNGNTSEGIVADDELALLYVAEEDVALWRYGAEPGDGNTRTAAVTVASGLIDDNIKNPSIYYGTNQTGYVVVSSQGGSNFIVLDRQTNAYIGSFEVGYGDGNGVDKVSGQDGAEVSSFDFGAAFPGGMFVSQDHQNTNSGNGNSGNQNYKYASWEDVAAGFSPPLMVDTGYDPRTVGAGDPGPDETPPQTTITSGPSGTTGSTSATFAFSANEPATFECSLNTAAWAGCASPETYTDLAESTHTFRVRATDTAGNTDATPASQTWTVDSSAPAILTFPAAADATVLSGSPSANFGTTDELLADRSPLEESLLRFDVQGLGQTVQNATLRLYATNGSTNGPEVYGVENGWQEASVTWDTKPQRTGGSVDDSAAVPTGTWMELDVTSLVGGNGPVSLNVAPTSSDGADFSSREALANPPELVVTTDGDPDPDPSGPIVRESVATTENTSAAPSVTVDRPSGTVAGDVLVSCVAANGARVKSSTTPEGWTRIAGLTGAGNPKVYGFYHVAEAGDPGSWTWELSSEAKASAGIARYSGVDAAEVLDGSPQTGTGDQAGSATLPGVTTAGTGSMLVGCMGVNSSNASVEITAPAPMAPAWDLVGKRQQLSDLELGAPGQGPDRTWAFSSGRKWAGWLVALRAD